MARPKNEANIIGPLVRKRRNEMAISQAKLVLRCQVAGLDISRVALAQIELGIRGVRDYELRVLADVLAVTTDSLFPPRSAPKNRKKN